MLNEFYRVAFRKKVYRSTEDLQADLDAWIKDYNAERPHQGRWCFGKTMNKVQRDDFGPLEGDAEPSDKHNYEFVVMS